LIVRVVETVEPVSTVSISGTAFFLNRCFCSAGPLLEILPLLAPLLLLFEEEIARCSSCGLSTSFGTAIIVGATFAVAVVVVVAVAVAVAFAFAFAFA